MSTIREIGTSETHLAYTAFLDLFSNFELSKEELVQQVNEYLRPEGFRLIGSFEDGIDTPVAVAGFRTMHTIAWGHSFYIDDLVTCAAFRGRGHATRLMQWLYEEARRLGCTQLHLDSAVEVHRYDAHSFYHSQQMHIGFYHFYRDL